MGRTSSCCQRNKYRKYSTKDRVDARNQNMQQAFSENYFNQRKWKTCVFTKSMTNNISLARLSITPLLINWGKNNQPLVTTTNPTVSNRDTVGLTTYRRTNSVLFTAISVAVQTPCNTKNKVISYVGISRVKYKKITSCATPEAKNVAKTPINLA